MCLAVPAKVVQLSGDEAVVDIGGSRMQADVSLLEKVAVGDYVLMHAGFAINRYKPEEAREVLSVLNEYFAQMERTDAGKEHRDS